MKRIILILTLICALQTKTRFRTSINHKLVKQVLAEENKDRALYAPWGNQNESEDTQNNKNNKNPTIKKPCVFCLQIHDRNDAQNFILKRFTHYAVALNMYPYTRGHLLLIPINHTKYLHEQSSQARAELIELTSLCVEILKNELNIESANIGMNFEKAGGTNISHHHMHIIPRYPNESSFIEIIGTTKIICWDLEELYNQLKPIFQDINIE